MAGLTISRFELIKAFEYVMPFFKAIGFLLYKEDELRA